MGCHRDVTATALRSTGRTAPAQSEARSRQGDAAPEEVPGSSSTHWMSPAGSSKLSTVLVKGDVLPPPGSTPLHCSEGGGGRSRTES